MWASLLLSLSVPMCCAWCWRPITALTQQIASTYLRWLYFFFFQCMRIYGMSSLPVWCLSDFVIKLTSVKQHVVKTHWNSILTFIQFRTSTKYDWHRGNIPHTGLSMTVSPSNFQMNEWMDGWINKLEFSHLNDSKKEITYMQTRKN